MYATTSNYSKKLYNTIVEYVQSFMQKIGFDPAFVPIWGLDRDNLTTRSVNMAWYEGLLLPDALDKMEEPKMPVDKQPHKQSLRLPLICMYKIGGVDTIFGGRVQTGELKAEMMMTFGPTSLERKVMLLEMHHESV